MRLRSRDTEYHDESKRALGMAKFLGELKTFLDDRVEGDGDGWAPVSAEDESKLYDLFKEIIALKWGTDADGDLPINFALCDRNNGYLNEFIIPYGIDRPKLAEQGLSEDEIDEKEELYWMDLARTAAHMASSAQELMRRFDNHYGDKLVKRKEARDRRELLDKTVTAINARADESQYEADRDLIFLLTKPKPFDEKRKEAGVFQQYPEAQEAMQAAMVAKYPARLAQAIEDISKLMAPYEDDDGEDFYNTVTKPRLEYIRVFGDAFNKHPDIGPKAQDLFQKGKLKRAAKRAAAAKPTPTTV
jgi:uncharacterized protein YdaT